MAETHTDRPSGNGGSTLVGVREFFQLWLERLEAFYGERDRRYEDRFRAIEGGTAEKFRAAEVAVAAALAAQEKAVNAAFLASEKAIVKAEGAQSDYNERSNEFRGQLDDQAKTLISKDEAITRFVVGEQRLEDAKGAIGVQLDDIKRQLGSLRETRSGAEAVHVQERDTRSNSANAWAVVLGIFGAVGVISGVIIAAAALATR